MFNVGFRMVGGPTADRRPTNWAKAFQAHCHCEDVAQCDRESYLSAFVFDQSYRDHYRQHWTSAQFDGDCFAWFLHFDIDRDDPEVAHRDAQTLATFIVDQFELDEELLQCWYSGSKGFHLLLPTSLWNPSPSRHYHNITKAMAITIAEDAGVAIDQGTYAKVQIFRAPNSRHAKTNLYKRHLGFHRLVTMTMDQVKTLVSAPAPMEIHRPVASSSLLDDRWTKAIDHVDAQQKANNQRRINGDATLNRTTMELIKGGDVAVGDRHRTIFSSAANLAEFGCPPRLASALLTNAGLELGLKPSDVRRQIECGLRHTSSTGVSSDGIDYGKQSQSGQ